MLTAFSKFKNAKTFYRQEELKELCMKVQYHTYTCVLVHPPPPLCPDSCSHTNCLRCRSWPWPVS